MSVATNLCVLACAPPGIWPYSGHGRGAAVRAAHGPFQAPLSNRVSWPPRPWHKSGGICRCGFFCLFHHRRLCPTARREFGAIQAGQAGMEVLQTWDRRHINHHVHSVAVCVLVWAGGWCVHARLQWRRTLRSCLPPQLGSCGRLCPNRDGQASQQQTKALHTVVELVVVAVKTTM